MNTKSILDAYEQGDENERLALFLQHRHLRREFEGIDQRSPVPQPRKQRRPCRACSFLSALAGGRG